MVSTYTHCRFICCRYAGRNNGPPPGYPPLGAKPIPPLMGNPQNDPPPGYRGRYDAPPFEDIPPGVDPPVPGFEPSPFEKPAFGPPGTLDRDRLPPPNYRDPYRAPFVEGPPGYRDAPGLPPVQSDIPVHIGEHPPRFRDNFRPPPGHFRDQPVTYRDGQPFREPGAPVPYRDGTFRTGPQPLFRDNNFRNNPYRDGNFRENLPHNFRDGPPFRPPSADPRDPASAIPYHDPNYRDGLRDENNVNRDMRAGYRHSLRPRSGARRPEHERHRDREGRDRERFNENREPTERPERSREVEKRSGYDKNREPRDDRMREYDRNRDYERERGQEKSPEKKTRVSPKRSRETRERKRSESRGRSRERDSRREKKDERVRDKSSADRNKEHKDKEKKIKERKKKKREKEKELEKKKKRDKKEKKDKDVSKKEDDSEKADGPQEGLEKPENNEQETEEQVAIKNQPSENEKPAVENPKIETSEKPSKANDDLYGDEAAEAVDKEIIQNYVKSEEKDKDNENNQSDATKISDSNIKDEPFDGIELQAPLDELEADIEGPTLGNTNSKEMLAPLPALSKWEVDDENIEKSKEPGEITSPEQTEDGGKVTSEVIKRAENAIFAKAINSLRPIEIKKISSDRLKLYGDEGQSKSSLNNIQITVPVSDQEQRSVEANDKKKRYSKTPPPRLSVKERLGGKVEDVRRTREPRVVHSTVERVKSRSKTPKREQMQYRRVTVERERGRKPESRVEVTKSEKKGANENVKSDHGYQGNSHSDYKKRDLGRSKDEKKPEERSSIRNQDKNVTSNLKQSQEHERKKSTLDEAHFEPDYDENVESENETKEETGKKRERSREPSPPGASESKKAKLDPETIKLDLTNVKKKPDSDSESSSDSEYSSSSSSSDAHKRKKKKKRSKKKKKRASDSESDSDSDSDDHKKKKKKRKHKKKSSKKKKKSKHK